QREANLLNLLAPTGVPAPRLVAVDSEGTACAVPALLMTRLRGAPPNRVHDLPSFVSGLAGALTVIHAVTDGATAAVPPYRRYRLPDALVFPEWLPPSLVWRRAFEAVAEPPPATRECFIHRDYHPRNTLWSRGRLTGVVDWTQA